MEGRSTENLKDTRPATYRGLASMLLFASMLVVAISAFGQQERLDEPVSSPVWWTLTDSVTPEQLKERHTNLAVQRGAYALATAMPSYPVPMERRAPAGKVVHFLDPSAEPEMVPFWFAYWVLSSHLTFSPEATVEKLEGTNLSGPGRVRVVDHLRRFEKYTAEQAASSRQDVADFLEILRARLHSAGASGERAVLYSQWQSGDLSALTADAERQGVDSDRLHSMFTAWKNPADIQAARLLLPQLKSSVSESDWAELRRFLLDEVATTIGTLMNTQPYD